ncbi:MAG TPA: methyltransferase [Acidimicrobiales bacterium]|nr:methyltransferase [Acidimicrobiales bacterium]
MGQQYFESSPEVPSSPAVVSLVLPDVSFSLTTDAGVFGRGGVDPGTKLLLLEAPPLPSGGDLLDLGCGYGPIALTMAARSPDAVVWAVDVNERARGLCAANAAAAGLSNVRVCAPDEVPSDVRFAALWSNPPIRIGKGALHSLLQAWLPRVDGESVLVVQKHLGADSLARWLVSEGHAVERLQSRMAYRLLRIT